MEKSLYRQQFCEKHNQYYGDHLHRCPICWGEELGKNPPKPKILLSEKKSGDKE